jgi:hypothetical protein
MRAFMYLQGIEVLEDVNECRHHLSLFLMPALDELPPVIAENVSTHMSFGK